MLIRRTEPHVMALPTGDGPLDKEIEKLVIETLDFWHVPGISVAVVDGNNTYAKVSFLPLMLPIFIRSRATASHLCHLAL